MQILQECRVGLSQTDYRYLNALCLHKPILTNADLLFFFFFRLVYLISNYYFSFSLGFLRYLQLKF